MTIRPTLFYFLIGLGALAQAQQNEPTTSSNRAATAEVKPTEKNTTSGMITFTAGKDVNTVTVRIALSNLEPNSSHGLHVHEKGDCSAADASSAGSHFNPAAKQHGDSSGPERHAGDLGNVKADAAGDVSTVIEIPSLSIDGGANGVVGRSVIVHAKPDDLKGQPAGNSGARIACGVIRADNK